MIVTPVTLPVISAFCFLPFVPRAARVALAFASAGLGPTLTVNALPLTGGGMASRLAAPLAQSAPDVALASDGTLYWTTNDQVQSLKP